MLGEFCWLGQGFKTRRCNTVCDVVPLQVCLMDMAVAVSLVTTAVLPCMAWTT